MSTSAQTDALRNCADDLGQTSRSLRDAIGSIEYAERQFRGEGTGMIRITLKGFKSMLETMMETLVSIVDGCRAHALKIDMERDGHSYDD